VALGAAGPGHQLEVARDLGDLLPGAALGRAPGRPDLDAGPDLGQIVEVVPIDPDQLGERRVALVGGGDDPGPAALDRGHEALGLELLQRRAYRDPADAHHLGELTLAGQALAGRQIAAGDQAQQLLGHTVRDAFAWDGVKPGIGGCLGHQDRAPAAGRGPPRGPPNWAIGNTTYSPLYGIHYTRRQDGVAPAEGGNGGSYGPGIGFRRPAECPPRLAGCGSESKSWSMPGAKTTRWRRPCGPRAS
jgi:hypothetical protein